MSTRPKRTIKPKRLDDEIYTPSIVKRRKVSIGVVKRGGSVAKRGRPKKSETKLYEDISEQDQAEENVTIFKRKKKLLEDEEIEEDSGTAIGSRHISKRMLKPTLKKMQMDQDDDEEGEEAEEEDDDSETANGSRHISKRMLKPTLKKMQIDQEDDEEGEEAEEEEEEEDSGTANGSRHISKRMLKPTLEKMQMDQEDDEGEEAEEDEDEDEDSWTANGSSHISKRMLKPTLKKMQMDQEEEEEEEEEEELDSPDEYFEDSCDEYKPSEILDSDAEEDIKYSPPDSSKRASSDSMKVVGNGSGKSKKKIDGQDISVDLTDLANEQSPATQKVEEFTLSTDSDNIPGKDKIMRLPNHRVYFEFAVPKRKMILQIKPPFDTQEFKSQTLMELLCSLKMRNLITPEAEELLEAFREYPDGLVRVKIKPKVSFFEAVKKFATVLYLYSPRAYDYVSTLFSLPSKASLQNRLQTDNYWPGFTLEARELLCAASDKTPVGSVCSIMLDSVSIKKGCQFDISDDRWIGYVDICGGPTPMDSDGIPLASEALLLTAVGIGHDWKLPFGYFLHNGLSGEALHSIVSQAIIVLGDCGLDVRLIVCDGCPSTIKMAVNFGCNIYTKSYKEIVTSFPHPVHENKRLHLLFGIRQSLDLLRNLLKDKFSLWSSTYGVIKWKYFDYLWDLEESKTSNEMVKLESEHEEFLRLQRILRQCHPSFNWMENKCFELALSLKLEEFSGTLAAGNFVADIYRAFDLLNSRNPVTSGEKPPLTNPFLPEQLESMSVIGQRIFGLEIHSGEKVATNGRWLSAVLFAFTLKSVSVFVSDLVNEGVLTYIRSYRLNLDHSDMVLSAMQRFRKWEGTVPTASEFREGYKALLKSAKALSSKISVFRNDFDGDDLTVGQGVICPASRNTQGRGFEDLAFQVRFSTLIDLRTFNELKAKCVLKHISDRLTCVDCMTLLLDSSNSDSLRGKNIACNVVRPSTFLLDLVKSCEKNLKAKCVSSTWLETEPTVNQIFSDYLCDTFWRIYHLPSEHLVEEPYHVISLIKTVIRICVNYRQNVMKPLSTLKSKLLKL